MSGVGQDWHFSSWDCNQANLLFGLPGSKWVAPVNIRAAASCHLDAERQHGADAEPEGLGIRWGWLGQAHEKCMLKRLIRDNKSHSNDFLDCLLERGTFKGGGCLDSTSYVSTKLSGHRIHSSPTHHVPMQPPIQSSTLMC